MENKLLIIISLVLSQIVFGQQDVYKIDPLHTNRKLKELNFEPELYSVVFKDVQFISEGKRQRVLNPSYIVLKREIEELNEENAVLLEDFEEKYKKYTDVEKIKSSINKFMSSESGFEIKKNFLIEAQKLALENGINELIYADASVNPTKKSKFLLLKLNKLDLKVHLKRVSWKLNALTTSLPLKDTKTEELLKTKQNQLENTRKYNYIETEAIKTQKSGLFLANKLESVKSLKGEFVSVGEYFILKEDIHHKFKKGEIVDHEVVISNQLINKGMVGDPKMLFKNTITNAVFLGNINFLRQYAFTINGKFNKHIVNKTSTVKTNAKSQLVSN